MQLKKINFTCARGFREICENSRPTVFVSSNIKNYIYFNTQIINNNKILKNYQRLYKKW